MDPFTIAKTTATCLSTTKALYELHSKYSNAPIVIVSICSESAIISTSLAQIQGLLLQRQVLGNAWASRTELANALDTALTGCMVLFSCLDDEVQAIIAHAPDKKPERIRWRGRVRVIWNEEKLSELLVALRGQQTAINLLVQLLQMNTLNEIKQMLQTNQGTIQASIHTTQSLRSQNTSVRVPGSIYGGPDAGSLFNTSYEDDQISVIAPSDIEFDFNDTIINSQAYRKVFAQAKRQMAVPPKFEEEPGDPIDFSDAMIVNRSGNTSLSQEEALSGCLQDLQGLTIRDPLPRTSGIGDFLTRRHTADYVTNEQPEVHDLIPIPLERTDLGWVLASSPIQGLKEIDLSAHIETVEKRTHRIWSVVSEFEEKSASFVSNMLIALNRQKWEDLFKQIHNLMGIISQLFESISLVAPEGARAVEAHIFCDNLINLSFVAFKKSNGPIEEDKGAPSPASLISGQLRWLRNLIRIGLQSSAYKHALTHDLHSEGGEDDLARYINCLAHFSDTPGTSRALRVQ